MALRHDLKLTFQLNSQENISWNFFEKSICFVPGNPLENVTHKLAPVFQTTFSNMLSSVFLKFFSKGSVGNKSVLVQVITWNWTRNKPLTETIMNQFSDQHIHHQVPFHYNDVIMSMMASQITSLTIVYSTIYSGTDQRKHQSSASLAFVRGIHQWPMNSQHKGPVMQKMFPFDDHV